jgi:hypothetical protein
MTACGCHAMVGLWHKIVRSVFSQRSIAGKVDVLDNRQREIRHDLKNIQTRTEALKRLVRRMREDDVWRNNRDDG